MFKQRSNPGKVPEIFSRNAPGSFAVLNKAKVGIAGAGGLGSNIAIMLTRTGIGSLIVVDFDVVVPNNLNRQAYFQEYIGRAKVDALGEILKKINPEIHYEPHQVRLDKSNIPVIFKDVDVMVEAFDDAEMKSMLIETWLGMKTNAPIVGASGLAGYGRCEEIGIKRTGRLILVGDCKSDLSMGLMSPRVMQVASIQANLVVEYLMERG